MASRYSSGGPCVFIFEKTLRAVGDDTHGLELRDLGLVRLHRIVPGIVPANQSLYKLEKQSGSESFRPTNPTQTNKALGRSQFPCIWRFNFRIY
jgi:hypothetical protein